MENLRKQVLESNIRVGLYLCLTYTKENKQDINKIGVAWVSYNRFILNFGIFANFIGKKQDTIKHHLNNHGFTTCRISSSDKRKYFDDLNNGLPYPGKWAAREHQYFNKDSNLQDAHSLEFFTSKRTKIRINAADNRLERVNSPQENMDFFNFSSDAEDQYCEELYLDEFCLNTT